MSRPRGLSMGAEVSLQLAQVPALLNRPAPPPKHPHPAGPPQLLRPGPRALSLPPLCSPQPNFGPKGQPPLCSQLSRP